VAKRERRHSEFRLDALVVVEVDITVDHSVDLTERSGFVTVDTFCFENGKEVFLHGIVVYAWKNKQ